MCNSVRTLPINLDENSPRDRHYPLDKFDFRALLVLRGGISVYELAGQRQRARQAIERETPRY